MSTELKVERKRRPAARHWSVVAGCIEEHIMMMMWTVETELHKDRLLELVNELRRGLGKEDE